MVYAQFIEKYPNSDPQEALGSDGVFILDGRNKLSTQIKDSIERMEKMKNVRPYYVGFQIIKGEKFSTNNFILYDKVVV